MTNTATGVIAGQTSTHVIAAQNVNNDGLINGGDTRIDAQAVANTGRIYGDSIAVGTGTLNNDINAKGIAGVIASRGDIDLGVGTLLPTFASDSGSSSATTRSAISSGTINITDQDHQTQDIANLSRDTTGANGAVSKLPDVNNLLNQQSDMMSAVGAASEAASKRIGEYADGKRQDARDAAQAAKDAGDMAGYARYSADAASWDEGGTNRIALHVASGGLVGGLGGGGAGSAAQDAAGAGLAAWTAGDLTMRTRRKRRNRASVRAAA